MSESRKKLGLVADSTTLEKYFRDYIGLHAFDIHTFDSEDPKLYNRLEELAPDILFIKQGLRSGRGSEICSYLKSTVAGRGIKIVLISSDPNLAAVAQESHADFAIRFPFSTHTLKKAIHRLLGGKATVLYAEDSTVLHDLIRPFFEERGIQIISTYSGDEARDALQKNKVDLVISDIEMPGLNGFELCRHVRQDPYYSGVPFIITSRFDSEEMISKCFGVGVSDYLSKPFLVLELFQRVQIRLGIDPEPLIRPEKILIVDNDKLTREVIMETLGYHGFQAIHSSKPAEILDMHRRFKIDLLILSIDMADEEGFKILQEIRRGPDGSGLPVVATAINSHRSPGMAQVVRLESLGVTRIIKTPFNYSELLAVVERLLAVQRLSAHPKVAGPVAE